MVQLAFFSSYCAFSYPSAKIIDFLGYQRAMVIGLLTMGVGAFLFVPAASAPSYPLFLTALIILAAGMTVLQTSANPYVAVLGPPRTAASRLNLTQAFNSLGTTVAPTFGSKLILGAVAAPVAIEVFRAFTPEQRHAYQVAQAGAVKTPVHRTGDCAMCSRCHNRRLSIPKIASVEAHGEVHRSNWKYRHLLLGALAIFLYVGAEVSMGSFLTNYFNRPEIGNLTLKDAADMLKYYWGGAMIGRFIGSAVLQRLKPGAVLGFNALVAALLVVISMLTLGQTAMWSILLVGLFNSIMFPTIFTLGIAGLGPLTADGSFLLIAAIIGGAIVPYVQGAFADIPSIGIHHAFFLPVLCYLYIAYYGFVGSKPKAALAAS